MISVCITHFLFFDSKSTKNAVAASHLKIQRGAATIDITIIIVLLAIMIIKQPKRQRMVPDWPLL